MAMFDDPGKNLRQMQEELLSEEFDEFEDEYEPPDYGRTVYEEEEYDADAAIYVEEPKKKGIGGLLLLAILEVAAILAIVGWWLQWL